MKMWSWTVEVHSNKYRQGGPSWVLCNVFIYSDCESWRDKFHSEKRFHNVQSRVKRVATMRITCVYHFHRTFVGCAWIGIHDDASRSAVTGKRGFYVSLEILGLFKAEASGRLALHCRLQDSTLTTDTKSRRIYLKHVNQSKIQIDILALIMNYHRVNTVRGIFFKYRVFFVVVHDCRPKSTWRIRVGRESLLQWKEAFRSPVDRISPRVIHLINCSSLQDTLSSIEKRAQLASPSSSECWSTHEADTLNRLTPSKDEDHYGDCIQWMFTTSVSLRPAITIRITPRSRCQSEQLFLFGHPHSFRTSRSVFWVVLGHRHSVLFVPIPQQRMNQPQLSLIAIADTVESMLFVVSNRFHTGRSSTNARIDIVSSTRARHSGGARFSILGGLSPSRKKSEGAQPSKPHISSTEF